MGRGRSGRASRPTIRTPRRDPRQYPNRHLRPEEFDNFFQNANQNDIDNMLNAWRSERMDNDNRSNDNDVQRFFHYVGWSENTPNVLDERQYQAARQAAGNPMQLYHADNDHANGTAQDFANQFFGRGYDFAGNQYRHYISNGIYGAGTYFASSARESAFYGTNQFRGFLNGNAKVADYSTLKRQYNSYSSSHPAFAAMMSRVTTGYGDVNEKLSIFAAMRGYNVIRDRGRGYYVVLDRNAMTVSTATKSTRRLRGDW